MDVAGVRVRRRAGHEGVGGDWWEAGAARGAGAGLCSEVAVWSGGGRDGVDAGLVRGLAGQAFGRGLQVFGLALHIFGQAVEFGYEIGVLGG